MHFYFNNQKKEANYDELTGVYNRRAFNKWANKIFYSNKSMFLMLMDADDFKIINDKYGHLEGDKALIQIAHILNRAINNTHKNYSLARYGGDEFVIVGNIQNKDEVAQLINQIEEEEKKYNLNFECLIYQFNICKLKVHDDLYIRSDLRCASLPEGADHSDNEQHDDHRGKH